MNEYVRQLYKDWCTKNALDPQDDHKNEFNEWIMCNAEFNHETMKYEISL